MTSTTERRASGSALPQAGRDRLRALASELRLLGLDARALAADGGQARGDASPWSWS